MDPAKLKEEKAERERQLRLVREATEAALRSRILAEETRQRHLQLSQTQEIIQDHKRRLCRHLSEKNVQEEWRHFLSVSSLPTLSQLASVNSYYEEWLQNCQLNLPNSNLVLDNIFKNTYDILKLLDEIREYLQFPPPNAELKNFKELGTMYHEIKWRQQELIDHASHSVLSDMRHLYDPEIGIIDHYIGNDEIQHCLWSNFYSCPQFDSHQFETVNFSFRLPKPLILVPGIYRLLKMEYDFYSDSSISFYPGTSTTTNILKSTIQNWIWKKEVLFRRLSVSKSSEFPQVDGDVEIELASTGMMSMGITGVEAVNEEQVSETFSLRRKWKSMTMKSKETVEMGKSTTQKSSGGSERESKVEDQNLNQMTSDPAAGQFQTEKVGPTKGKEGTDTGSGRVKTEAERSKDRERAEKAAFIPRLTHPTELNLRNYQILGGIYDFRLLQIPHQPREVGIDSRWTLHDIKKNYELEGGGLVDVSFVAEFCGPHPGSTEMEIKRTPEEMEREAKRIEEELQKLVLVEIKVPKTAFWFEPPKIVRWKSESRTWSTDGFFDIKFNEDSLQLSFRITHFGIIGLAHNRWSNLPYQSWELRPLGSNSVSFNLMAAIVVVEFIVKDDLISVSSIQNVGNSDIIEGLILGQFMKPHRLVHALRSHGLDLFPEPDSYAYVDGILLKHSETEDHLYQCMAIAAGSFNFHWSRWNMLAGRNKLVYQMRERHGGATPGNYQMVLNTPHSVSLIDCTEVSPNYSEEPLGGQYEYHADLLHMIGSIATAEAKEKMDDVHCQFVDSVCKLLKAIKCLSFA